MFGFYELQMPSFLQTRLSERTRAIRGGAMAGVFVLGMISSLIVGACASPVLLTLLGAAILSHDPVLGGGIMLALAHGQGVLLVAIGVGAGWLVPKAGMWMERVKQVFGVMLLAVAIYLIGTLPGVPVLLLWAALFIITAVYLGATQTLPPGASGWGYFRKGVGTLLLIWGVLALLGGIAGERDILKPLPLAQLKPGGAAAPQTAAVSADWQGKTGFERVRSVQELEARLAAAKRSGRPVLVDYFAEWCTDCLRVHLSHAPGRTAAGCCRWQPRPLRLSRRRRAARQARQGALRLKPQAAQGGPEAATALQRWAALPYTCVPGATPCQPRRVADQDQASAARRRPRCARCRLLGRAVVARPGAARGRGKCFRRLDRN
jgi:thiol:disulfide interchange protein DsbD